MTRERRRLIDEIFLSAADLSPAQRPAFLATACPDEEIVREVNSLLQYDGADVSALEDVVHHAAASLISGDKLIGAHLGPYRISEELGKGGMGAVFLAVRDDQTFEKKVAVKVVKRGMDSDAVLDRFRHERRILATLDHPYISRLFDAGTTPDGRPYFVMEFVEGHPIVEYCASHRLDLRARLELFRKVCDAVSFAHRKLVIHRDLKTGNILVSADGSPKLLDFGIAKLLDPQYRAEDTAPARRMLTLSCASPEQVRGETVTTATDVYSLGLLLFELLTGSPPWDFRNISPEHAEKLIFSTAPAKPSTLLRDAGGNRSPRWRDLTGDLDNIVLMALRKDPAQRYRSVDELSEDLHRYQSGLPVIACEDSVSYKSFKFVRRHWMAAVLAGTAVSGLLGGIIYANFQRHKAEVRLTQMLGMANQTLLDLHTQVEHQPGATETRLRITQSTLSYLAGIAKEAGNNQDVRTTLAVAYMRTGDMQGYPSAPNLGDKAGALASYEHAEKLLNPNDHVQLADLLRHRGEVLCQLGRVPECLAALRKGLDLVSRSDTREALLVKAGIYHRLAYVLTQSDPDAALANSSHEMEIYTTLAKREPDNAEVLDGLASSYSTTGGALNRRNRLEEALALYRKGVTIRERLVARHPNDVTLRRNLMISYGRVGDVLGNPSRRNLGDRAGALANLKKSQIIAESLAGADPLNQLARMDVAQIRSRIGAVMDSPGQVRESLAILDDARGDVMSLLHGKEPVTEQLRVMSLIDEYRGMRLSALGDSTGALAAFRQSLDEAESAAKNDPTDSSALLQVLYACRGMAPELAVLGRRDEALRVAHDTFGKAAAFAESGPDTMSMAVFVPRSSMWIGETYEALARKGTSRSQRRVDWKAAADNYMRAAESWKKMRSRPDFFRFQTEINECAKKAAECSYRANITG